MTQKKPKSKKRNVELELTSFKVRLSSRAYSTKLIEIRLTPKGTPMLFQEGNDLISSERICDLKFLIELGKSLFHKFNLETVPYIETRGAPNE